MKINGTIFSKPQQDQLKRGIGEELNKVVAKVEDVDARMLNYMGDWASGNEYHENDVVTWGTDGHLYEVIKAHTSSATFDPDNPEYYKAMTARKTQRLEYTLKDASIASALATISSLLSKGVPMRILVTDNDNNAYYMTPVNEYASDISGHGISLTCTIFPNIQGRVDVHSLTITDKDRTSNVNKIIISSDGVTQQTIVAKSIRIDYLA